MNLKNYIFILSLLFLQVIHAQSYYFQKTDSIKTKIDAFSVDNFGRISFIQNDVIVCVSSTLDTLFKTSLKSFRPNYIESSKSFRTLLFDRERSIIHFLDNTMTDIHGEIDLINLDIQLPWLVCESFGGNTIWVLDAGAMRLMRINENLQRVQLTENLNLYFEDNNLPTAMMEAHDKLFMLVPEKGILIFDLFGTYIKTIASKTDAFDVYNNFLMVVEDSTLRAIPLMIELGDEQIFNLNFEVKQFEFKQDKIYCLTDEGLYIGNFRIKE